VKVIYRQSGQYEEINKLQHWTQLLDQHSGWKYLKNFRALKNILKYFLKFQKSICLRDK